jgi:hypothetical protein
VVAAKFVESPLSVLDYQIKWADKLASPPAPPGDAIATSTWTPDAHITLTNESQTDTTATVTVALNSGAGGVTGVEYDVVNVITTVGGRVYARTLTFEFLPE